MSGARILVTVVRSIVVLVSRCGALWFFVVGMTRLKGMPPLRAEPLPFLAFRSPPTVAWGAWMRVDVSALEQVGTASWGGSRSRQLGLVDGPLGFLGHGRLRRLVTCLICLHLGLCQFHPVVWQVDWHVSQWRWGLSALQGCLLEGWVPLQPPSRDDKPLCASCL